MTRLEERRRFAIFEGQFCLTAAIRHIAARAGSYIRKTPGGSYVGDTLVCPPAESYAIVLMQQKWRELERERRQILRARAKRRRAA
jgi:hypothetical protein